jgi:hypothetical protein
MLTIDAQPVGSDLPKCSPCLWIVPTFEYLFFFILFPTCHERSINVTPIMGSIEIPTAMSRRTGTAAAEAGRREHRRRSRPQRETVCGTRCCHCQEEEQK